MFKKFKAAFSGIAHAVRKDKGFRIQIIIGLAGLSLTILLGWPLSENDVILMTLATIFVLVTELQNSAFERALDKLHPELNDSIGRSKDMAAGAVLLAAFFAFSVATVIVIF